MKKTQLTERKGEKIKLINKKQSKGITLIALVITIIVLLILAGVTINTLFGNENILEKASEAREEDAHGNVKDQIQLELVNYELEKGTGETDKTAIQYLSEKGYFSEEYSEETKSYTIKTDKIGNANIGKGASKDAGDVYVVEKESDESNNWVLRYYKTSSEFKDLLTISIEGGATGPEANIEENYVGYYADLDGNPTTAEGIIYADLAAGSDGEKIWNDDSWSNYEYDSTPEGLKSYIVGENVASDKFGNKELPIITEKPGTKGNNRFYVMALEDFDNSTHYWYKEAYGNLKNTVATDYNDFGEGKTNTSNMIEIWTKGDYGEQNSNDMWGIIKDSEQISKYNLEWFVPSKAEWAAFGDMLYTKFEIDTNNYDSLNLKKYYWSSSQRNSHIAYSAQFFIGSVSSTYVYDGNYVRLSATF